MRRLYILLASASDAVCAYIDALVKDRTCDYRVDMILDPTELEARLAERTPDILFLEKSFDGRHTVALTDWLIKTIRGLRIVVFTLDDYPPSYAALFVARGAESFICLRTQLEELRTAIDLIVHGKRYLPAAVEAVMDRHDMVPPVRGGLTGREREIGRLIAAGLTVREISVRLNLSPKTVDTHRSHIYEKTNSQRRSEFVAYARETGLITREDECLYD